MRFIGFYCIIMLQCKVQKTKKIHIYTYSELPLFVSCSEISCSNATHKVGCHTYDVLMNSIRHKPN